MISCSTPKLFVFRSKIVQNGFPNFHVLGPNIKGKEPQISDPISQITLMHFLTCQKVWWQSAGDLGDYALKKRRKTSEAKHNGLSLISKGDHHYPRDAMLARVFATATCPSVCLSVRTSVTRQYCA